MSQQQQQTPQQTVQYKHENQPQQQIIVQQPTVRVMRLYKPCMHVINTIPPTIESSISKNADFAVSSFLLLPDSFGDIYTGELFSAYIAVVNGNQDCPFNAVTLSVRLQTTNATHDLLDCRPVSGETSGFNKILNPNEAVDVVVKHTLTELGTHTLRVSVQYFSRQSSEPKTLRKFYRFNVLHPLRIISNGTDMGDNFFVQCFITNTTKSPLFIEEKDAEVVLISAPRSANALADPIAECFNLDSLLLLLPEECYACVFSVAKSVGSSANIIGCPEMKWLSYMGEHGLVRGSESIVGSSNTTSTILNAQQQQVQSHENQQVHIDCISSPSSAVIGIDFEIVLRITNNTAKQTSLQLICRDTLSHSYYISPAIMTATATADSNKQTEDVKKNQVIADSQLFVTGLSNANIGVLEPGKYRDMIITVCAVDLGLQELRGIFVVDQSSLREYHSKPLMKVIVTNS